MRRLFVLCLMLLTVAACVAPPPPPVAATPPPSPPAPPPTYLVFFDWNSASVSPGGSEVIQLAANAYRAGAPVTVQVTGGCRCGGLEP